MASYFVKRCEIICDLFREIKVNGNFSMYYAWYFVSIFPSLCISWYDIPQAYVHLNKERLMDTISLRLWDVVNHQLADIF